MAELRYVILDDRKDGNGDVIILPEGTAEDEARKKLDSLWRYLTPKEQKGAVMSLVLMAVEDDESDVISWDSDSYAEALERGWDTLSAYTPIEARKNDI